jgi:aspartate kinase
MIIMKFGGTSVKNELAMQNVAGIISANLPKKPVIVVSALAGVTDMLERSLDEALHQRDRSMKTTINKLRTRHTNVIDALFQDTSSHESLKYFIDSEIEKLRVLLGALGTVRVDIPNLRHAALSIGEILSSRILNALLRENGIDSTYVDARKFMFTTDSQEGPVPLPDEIAEAAGTIFPPLLRKHKTVVTQGFVAATLDGVPTTLGRNGSDHSASLLGAALEVEEIQIWTDVNGILTADPTIIPYARPLDLMTFDEACELSYFGARVLHPAAIQPALKKGIPVRVLNSQHPEENGTLIVEQNIDSGPSLIKSVAYKENITLITLQSSSIFIAPDLLGRFFQEMARYGKHVYAVNKSATRLSLTIENTANIDRILEKLPLGGEARIESEKAIVSVVGSDVQKNPQVTWQILKLLQGAGVYPELIAQNTSQISFMFIIDQKDINKTVRLLHKSYIESHW